MKAIVSISQTAQGERVSLMGYGATESIARVAAYTLVNHGRNDFDTEFDGGTLISISTGLESLINAKGWDDTYNEGGELVGSRANDSHLRLMAAMSNLRIKDGKLDYEEIQVAAADNTVLDAIKAIISGDDSAIDYTEENY